MAIARSQVFISATTRDLGGYRQVVRDELLTAGYFPVLQEHFPPDTHSLSEFLERAIAPCDVVICLLGPCFGAGPRSSDRVGRSYTQMEYDLAIRLAKPVYAFIASEQCDIDAVPNEDEHARQLQQAHIQDVMAGLKCQYFSSKDQLRQHILRIVPLLPNVAKGPARLQPRFVHLPREQAFFTGRKVELQQLTEAIERPAPCIIAVLGIGGQGKTTLVWQWLKQRGSENCASVLWCTAYRNGFTFDMFLDEALSYLLGDRFNKRDYPDVESRVRRLVACMQSANSLFVIDGIERWLKGWTHEDVPQEGASTGDRAEAQRGLDDFLSQVSALTNGAHVIFTSRVLPACLDGVAYAVIPIDHEGKSALLEGLDDDAAVALLKGLGVHGGPEDLLPVIHRYANHPLALSVLGALITEGYGGRIDRLVDVSALDHKNRLFELLEETRKHLPEQDLPLRYLQVAAHFIENPCFEPLSALLATDVPAGRKRGTRGGYDGRQLREVTVMLAKWNLIGWDAEREVIQLHPLVKDYFGGLAKDGPAIHHRLACWYAQQTIPSDASTLAHVRTRVLAIEHALKSEAKEMGGDLLFAPLAGMRSFAQWLATWGHLTFGIDLLGRLGEAAHGHARSRFTISRGAMMRQLGRIEESIETLTEAISSLHGLRTRFSRSRRLDLCGAYINRGNAQREIGELTLGLRDYDNALGWLPRATAGDPVGCMMRADVLINRGNTLRDSGRLTEAVADCSQAIAIYRELSEKSAPGSFGCALASTLLNRANAFADADRFDEAQADYLAAHALCDELIQRDQREALPVRAQLHVMRGATLTDANRAAEAVLEIEKGADILKICVDQGRSDLEPVLALAWMNLGHARLRTGDAAGAVVELDKAVTTFARLTRAGRKDVVGWLAWSYLDRAAARNGVGRSDGAKEDRTEGFRVLNELLSMGFWVFHVSMVKKQAQAIEYLATTEPAESAEMVNVFAAEAMSVLGTRHATEKFLLELRKGMRTVSRVATEIKGHPVNQAGLDAVRQAMVSQDVTNRDGDRSNAKMD